MDKSALEQLLSTYNHLIGFSTIAVALGILGEYVAHFVFEKEARRNRMEIVFSVLFGILVLGGVVGEYVFGSRLSTVSGQLQNLADTEVAESNRYAETAHKEAETAHNEADSFERDIVNARRDAAVATERAAEANKIAEGERLARLKIEEKLAPRNLNKEQQQRIEAALKPFSGTPYELGVDPGPEATHLLPEDDPSPNNVHVLIGSKE